MLRPFKQSDYRGAYLKQLWGREEMEAAWQQQGDLRTFLGEQLNAVARILCSSNSLAILLETRTPRLMQLSGEKQLLGYVAYFFDCLERFHNYEQPAPVATTLADAGAVSPKLSLRQVALLYVYTGRVIPPNADAIAKQFGHESGRTLYKRYLEVVQWAGRIGEDVQGKKLAPMIADITAVLPHLTDTARQQAESEQKTLEAKK